MKYFDRVCEVDITPDIKIAQHRIVFDIFKSIESDKNSCRIDIYNLSDETRNKIANDISSLVRVSAGYMQNLGLLQIGQGNISNVLHTIKSPDIITTIYSKDGFYATRRKYVSFSFAEKTRLKSVVDKIATELNLPVSFSNYTDATVETGYSFVGNVKDALDELALQYNFSWSIQNGELVIIKANTSTNKKVVFLSATTGLIENPQKIIKTKTLDDIQRDEYKVVSLLQPQLEAGDIVEIDSKIIKGRFTIFEVGHKGDTRGNDWYTTMTIYKSL